MGVDSVPLDPTCMDTLPLPDPMFVQEAPAPAAPTISELDRRIAELQFLSWKGEGAKLEGSDNRSTKLWCYPGCLVTIAFYFQFPTSIV